ncbi:glutathione S-transferase N-terminal domain-containing protein [bacterium]|nr:glutathione S-transferase N-terminal domain-containing protein [bacterium]
MITLYHLENSRSIRILWLLEELGLEYKLVHFKRDVNSKLAPEDFQKLSTSGKAPLIIDGDKTISESGAIIEYLLDYHANGKLRPAPCTNERDLYNYWMHAAEGSIMNIALVAFIMNRFDELCPFLFKPIIKIMTSKTRENYINPNLEKLYDQMESDLSKHTWFAGNEFSGADIQMGFVMLVLEKRAKLDQRYPNCQRWIQQMKERDSYKRAMEKNGPFGIL